jgi:hypothetical protein
MERKVLSSRKIDSRMSAITTAEPTCIRRYAMLMKQSVGKEDQWILRVGRFMRNLTLPTMMTFVRAQTPLMNMKLPSADVKDLDLTHRWNDE